MLKCNNEYEECLKKGKTGYHDSWGKALLKNDMLGEIKKWILKVERKHIFGTSLLSFSSVPPLLPFFNTSVLIFTLCVAHESAEM